jgi:hypothetical protein
MRAPLLQWPLETPKWDIRVGNADEWGVKWNENSRVSSYWRKRKLVPII